MKVWYSIQVWWNNRKPWQRYAIVGGAGLLIGLIFGALGNSPAA